MSLCTKGQDTRSPLRDGGEEDWSIVGKVVLITGANTGIGKATALELARRGAARIVIACRNVRLGEEAAEDIRKEVKSATILVRQLDLSSNDSVRRFASEFLVSEPVLHVLVNNAGMLGPATKTLSSDGNELTFATNHLGHFLLTNLLLDLIKQSAPSRIINLTSHWLMFRLYGGGRHVVEDPNFEKTSPSYSSAMAYSQSKLANVLFTRVHPGVVGSDIARDFNVVLQFLFTCLMKSTANGARTSVYCATEPGIEHLSSNYFMDCVSCSPGDFSDELAEQLWQLSEQLTARKT